MKQGILFLLVLTLSCSLYAQNTLVEGYTYEDGNRGYLNQVKITVYTKAENIVLTETYTDMEGKFACTLPPGQSYRLNFKKDIFHDYNDTVEVSSEKIFRKISMKRKPGYLFDVTLAESRSNENQVVDAIAGTRIEVYNRTTKKPEWVEEYHKTPYFQHNLEQGNHYTLMFRKQGYADKRIEAHVNIDGCIICIEGVSELRPGVVDNLTANNTMGTLLANIDMKKVPKFKPSGMHDSIWVKTVPSLEEMVREEEMNKSIQQMSEQKEVKIEQNINVEQPAVTSPARDRQLPEANNSVKLPQKVEEEPQKEMMELVPTEVMRESVKVEDVVIVQQETKIIEAQNAKTSELKYLTPLPEQFTGYTIEIGSYQEPVAEDNPEFKKSGQIYFRKEADNKYYYYSGSATSPQRIISYFETVVKPRFGGSRICLFKDGVKEYVK